MVASLIRHGMAGDIDSLRRCALELHDALEKSGNIRQAALNQQAVAGQTVPLNTNTSLDLPEFPKAPPYSGCWRPVYWTPMSGSSEQLTAWVAARGDDGQTCLLRAIRKEVLSAAFGKKKADGLWQLFAMVENELTEWLANANPYAENGHGPSIWTGFRFGAWRTTLANDVRHLAACGIRLGAAFANPEFADLNA